MPQSLDRDLFSRASIAFDLDGTLVDTAPDLVRALNAVIRPRGLSDVLVEDVRAMVGRGARALIERAHARQGAALEEETATDLVAAFIEVYKSDVAAESRIFPQVEDTLAALRDAGASLSVCTNKPSILSDLLLQELGLMRFFDRVIGPERTAAKKPAAEHVHDALGQGHEFAGMVGDSAPDAGAARAAGVPCLIMSYGYSEQPAGSLGADRLLDEFSHVPESLAALWRPNP
ncbi:HAD hydrolase-like protein [Maricaulis sp.]|uniref:HAD hydrolase-like protein n=1 Tax=Maricaulis sp. TaxID=1486257 RepID=UPI0026236B9A|nr:HAD hydrolase-like protein [Maricaulis sp.]